MAKPKINYTEGTCFFVPLRQGGFARGLVARHNGAGQVLAYFFGPRLNGPTGGFAGLNQQGAILVGLCGDLGLLSGEWPIGETTQAWDRADWPFPPLFRADEAAKRAWLSYYDEDTLELVREEPTKLEQGPCHPYDRLMGSGSVEIRLTKLLSEEA